MLIVLGYLATMIMGVTLGLLGGGGSILTVPILVYLFGLPAVEATAYSLFIVGLAALIGSIKYFKSGQIKVKTGLIFAIPSFIGVYLTRAYLIPWLPEVIVELDALNFTLFKDQFIMLVFSLLMIFASVSMIKDGKATKKAQISPSLRLFIVAVEGLVVGAITGFVGAGGGFLIVPALVVLIGLPMKTAVGTSLMIIALKSLIGVTGDLQAGLAISWPLLIALSLLGIIGIFIGGRLSHHVPDKLLKKGFGYFVLVMGVVITLSEIIS